MFSKSVPTYALPSVRTNTLPASVRIIPAGKSRDDDLTAEATSAKVKFNSLSLLSLTSIDIS